MKQEPEPGVTPERSARERALEASEAVFRNIVASMADGIVIVDRAGAVRFANPAAERLLGCAAGALLGEAFGFPVLASEATEIDVLRHGTPVVAELRVADTEWAGEPARIASLRDVTDRRRAEEDARTLIREQAARVEAEAGERRARFLAEAASLLATSLDYDQTLQSLAELVVPWLAEWCIVDVLGEDGQFRRVATAHADPAAAPAARIVGAMSPKLDAPNGVAATLRQGDAAILTGRGAGLRAGIGVPGDADSDEGVPIGSATIAPLVSRGRRLGALTLLRGNGRAAFLPADLALATELADRAAVAVDNARLYQKAQAASVAKSEFLAIMSHELRTPLNAVIGYADLLLLGVPAAIPRASQTHVERIRTSAHHLLSLIEEILTYSRVEAGREDIRTATFDPADVIEEALALTRPLFDHKDVALERSPLRTLPRMHSDPDKLRQILINLLSNAAKFTDAGAVSLHARASTDSIEFVVQDTGWGIDAQHLESIFQPFWQAESSRTRRAEGTGLGLTVAQRLARMLGGEIAVQSETGVGSTFTLRMPVRAPIG